MRQVILVFCGDSVPYLTKLTNLYPGLDMKLVCGLWLDMFSGLDMGLMSDMFLRSVMTFGLDMELLSDMYIDLV